MVAEDGCAAEDSQKIVALQAGKDARLIGESLMPVGKHEIGFARRSGPSEFAYGRWIFGMKPSDISFSDTPRPKQLHQ